MDSVNMYQCENILSVSKLFCKLCQHKHNKNFLSVSGPSTQWILSTHTHTRPSTSPTTLPSSVSLNFVNMHLCAPPPPPPHPLPPPPPPSSHLAVERCSWAWPARGARWRPAWGRAGRWGPLWADWPAWGTKAAGLRCRRCAERARSWSRPPGSGTCRHPASSRLQRPGTLPSLGSTLKHKPLIVVNTTDTRQDWNTHCGHLPTLKHKVLMVVNTTDTRQDWNTHCGHLPTLKQKVLMVVNTTDTRQDKCTLLTPANTEPQAADGRQHQNTAGTRQDWNTLCWHLHWPTLKHKPLMVVNTKTPNTETRC